MRKRNETAILFGCLLAVGSLVAGLAHAREATDNPQVEVSSELLMDGAGWYGLGVAETPTTLPDSAPTDYSPSAHCGLGYGLQLQIQLH